MDSKQPNKPYIFFIDADTIAYMGAATAEKKEYQWINEDGSKSPKFNKANMANNWLYMQHMHDLEEDEIEVNPSKFGWVRDEVVTPLHFADAKKAANRVIDNYIKTVKKFCNPSKTAKVSWYFTDTLQGTDMRKVKDIDGLEDRYQFSRKDSRKPVYLHQTKLWLLDSLKNSVMAPKGIEADELVISVQAHGENGCAMSCDKDLRTIEKCWFVNLNPLHHQRQLEWASSLGYIEQKGRKIVGLGFKYFCYQVIAGDSSDGYKGLKGYGDQRALNILKNCGSKQECIKALLEVYTNEARKGSVCPALKAQGVQPEKGFYQYLSWDGQHKKLTPLELLQQHCVIAYQRRKRSEVFNVCDYLWN